MVRCRSRVRITPHRPGKSGIARRADDIRAVYARISSLGAPVAQLDRASGYEPEGRGFESLRARHLISWHSNKFRIRLFWFFLRFGNIREQNHVFEPLHGVPLPSWKHVRIAKRGLQIRMSQDRLRHAKRLVFVQ